MCGGPRGHRCLQVALWHAAPGNPLVDWRCTRGIAVGAALRQGINTSLLHPPHYAGMWVHAVKVFFLPVLSISTLAEPNRQQCSCLCPLAMFLCRFWCRFFVCRFFVSFKTGHGRVSALPPKPVGLQRRAQQSLHPSSLRLTSSGECEQPCPHG